MARNGDGALGPRVPLAVVITLAFACFTAGFFWGSSPELGTANLPSGSPGEVASLGRKALEGDVGVLSLEKPTDNGHVKGSLADFETMPYGKGGGPEAYDLQFQVLSLQPRAFWYPNFMDNATCDEIVRLSNARLAPSGVAWRVTDTQTEKQDFRTSQGTFITSGMDPSGALKRVEEKMAAVIHTPSSHGEAFNVLRYELGQKYESHYDTFDPAEYGPQSSQRMATMLLYLSDVEEGGETVFPKEGMTEEQMKEPVDYRACDKGLVVKPKKGAMLLFYSTRLDGTFDKHALHGGCPVKKGTKWVATKWVRDKGPDL